jgi:bifunctional UDP-N-acetylglucosamine pyrophosphorylase/glucosamine-1-phosphate N-acetyltransferase
MVIRILRTITEADFSPVCVVINPLFADQVVQAVANAGFRNILFRIQPERRGSADAVLQALTAFDHGNVHNALVIYADMPLWSEETILKLAINHTIEEPIVSMVSVSLSGAPPGLFRYGRIIRNTGGRIQRIVEPADATPEELAFETINPSLWIWSIAWLRRHAPLIAPTPKHDGFHPERYMPPLIGMAASQGHIIEVAVSDHVQALGVNTPEELELVRQIVASSPA